MTALPASILLRAQFLLEGDVLSPVSVEAVIARATDVLGSCEEAARWLSSPAIGLDRQRPIDLLHSTDGIDAVMVLLVRMDCGIYA